MASIALILLVFAFVLSACAAFNVPSARINLFAAGFACFMLALILGGVSTVMHINGGG